MSEWRECKLGDLTELVTKGTTPSISTGGFTNSGINFVKSESISYDGKIDKTKFAFISDETHEKLKRSQLKVNDILFSMAGVFLGKSALVTKDILPANTNQALAIIRLNSGKANHKFINYFLRQSSVIELVNNMSGQSAQPNINFQEIKSIEVNLPDIPEQKAIAAVLSSLDDKIDLLHRQNKTLEAMAETLFKQWFVIEAREDWEEKQLGELLAITSSKRIFYSEYVETGVPFYRSKEIIELHNTGNTKSELCISENRFNEIKEKFGAPIKGDILLTSVGTLGIPYRVKSNDNFYFKDGNLTWFKDFTSIPSIIIYCWLKSSIGKEQLDSITIGSTQAALTISGLKEIKLIIPSKEKIKELEENLIFFYDKIDANQKQIQTLETLRNNLLPKLMSGEVRVNYL